MNIPIKSRNSKTVNLEKAREREAWHKLAVKVIVWKDGLSVYKTSKLAEKISLKEWNIYYKRVIATNIVSGKEKVMADLKETWEKIASHGGFE